MAKRKKEPEIRLPKIKQLPSGAWHTRVLIENRRVSITKDTYDECVAEYLALKNGVIEAKAAPGKRGKTLGDTLDKYIAARKGFKSPSTIYAYESYRKQRFQSMMAADVYTTTDEQWQAAIRREARSLSPKYIKNVWMLISAAIFEETGRRPRVTLPEKEHNEKPYLDPDQIPVFLQAIKGESIEIAALLELSSLRRSEMLALTWDKVDFKNEIIYVHGARVAGDGGKLVHKKQNKNDSPRRTVPIIEPLMEALKAVDNKEGYVVNLTGGWICTRINEICSANGLPKVGNHGLRHSFASLAYHLQMPKKIAMKIGGWADDETMHKIYTHVAQKDIAKMAQGFRNFFSSSPSANGKIGNKIGNEK